MPIIQRGARGPAVERIQRRLKQLGRYLGPIDGDFGGATESAIVAFQRANNLTADGKVGSKTLAALFEGQSLPTIPPSPLVKKPLSYRCLALTGSFETSFPPPECFAGITGDFDQQGISFGVLQWNFGQGSLPPLLSEMNTKHPDIIDEIFHENSREFRRMLTLSRAEQLAWARSKNNSRGVVVEPWNGLFKTLGRRDEFQDIEVEFAQGNFNAALQLCSKFGLTSERAAALMFDIKTQNGSISTAVTNQILQDFAGLGSGNSDALEVKRLRIIANRRAEAARPRFIEDVRKRKLTIANGEGDVHGRHYNLEADYGIRLARF
jgi:hypothetical protein